MTEAVAKTYTDYRLPVSVVTKVDVSHLVDDLERLDGELTSASVREKTGAAAAAQPAMSQQLADFLSENTLTINDGRERMDLIKQLRQLKDAVPVVHMTFAVEADPVSLKQIAQWLRDQIDPRAVIAVGLQPGLVAGVYLRTPNHIHDLSLRGRLAEQRGLLAQELGALRGNR